MASATKGKTKTKYTWRKKDFVAPQDQFQGEIVEPTDPTGITETPLLYFKRFVTQEMIELIVDYTNRYSVQKQGKCVNTSVKEIQQVLGMYFKMALVEMPSIRMYWEKETRYPPVTEVMSRNRFQLLLSLIHFVDNETVSEETKKDRLWKIQPFLDMFRARCLQTTPAEHQSIDEMMVPYKGKFGNIRHYIRGKLHPWGFKVWARCSVQGLLHDFDVYQGKGGDKGANVFGIGGDVVVKLCETLPKDVGHKIYADNFFTSVELIEKLSEDGFLYAGTVRKNRLAKCNVLEENALKKKGRGSHDFRVESKTNTMCVRWQDSKAVTLMSNYAGPEPMDKARRWDKSKKDYTNVDRPYIIREYNTHMGCVDMLDAHISRCKYSIRTRRWYLILFWHFTSIGVINAWLLYKRDCSLLGITGKSMMKLRQFQSKVAQALIERGTTRKSGRPSLDEETSPKPPKIIRVEPCEDARLDQIAHWPVKRDKRRRCAVCKTIKTDTCCEKCDVPLCFNERRNCYKLYHIK